VLGVDRETPVYMVKEGARGADEGKDREREGWG
jgi:hypothetical protein